MIILISGQDLEYRGRLEKAAEVFYDIYENGAKSSSHVQTDMELGRIDEDTDVTKEGQIDSVESSMSTEETEGGSHVQTDNSSGGQTDSAHGGRTKETWGH